MWVNRFNISPHIWGCGNSCPVLTLGQLNTGLLVVCDGSQTRGHVPGVGTLSLTPLCPCTLPVWLHTWLFCTPSLTCGEESSVSFMFGFSSLWWLVWDITARDILLGIAVFTSYSVKELWKRSANVCMYVWIGNSLPVTLKGIKQSRENGVRFQ